MESQANLEPRGTLTIQIVAMPADTNMNGDIFGGWVVSHMDMATGIAARRLAKCRTVTRAIEKLEFLHPVNVGDTCCFYAELIKTGRTSMTFKIEVWTIALENIETQRKAAEGHFTFVAIDHNGKPQPVHR